jgi:hypothetical protein
MTAACERGSERLQDEVQIQDEVQTTAGQSAVSPAEPERAAAKNPYSPYGVQVHENQHFDVVTFKDVGVSHFGEQRDPLLEAIADSLAMNMSIDPTMPYIARLVHDEEFANPDSHIYCDMNHIYVDVWTSEEPDRWGYSLWSGCSESDQFAHEELEVDLHSDDYLSAVQALTNRIADDIRRADRDDCFTQSC